MKKIVWIFSIALIAFACNNESKTDSTITVKDGETRSKLSAGSVSEADLKAAAEKREEDRKRAEEEKMANQTTMEISPSVFDFGNIPPEVPVSTKFKITNTGDKPLIINDASASCGCTVPKKPEEPIMPGDSYDLEVTFTSNPGQAGTAINKTVTVNGNVPGGSKTVSIKAQVSK